VALSPLAANFTLSVTGLDLSRIVSEPFASRLPSSPLPNACVMKCACGYFAVSKKSGVRSVSLRSELFVSALPTSTLTSKRSLDRSFSSNEIAASNLPNAPSNGPF